MDEGRRRGYRFPYGEPPSTEGSGGTEHRFHQISRFVPPLVPPLLLGWAWTAIDGHGLQVVDSPKKKGVHWISVDALGWGYGGGTRNRTRVRHLNQIRKQRHCRCPPVRNEHLGNPTVEPCARPDNHKNAHSHPFLDAVITRPAWTSLAKVPFWD